jgi:hypothetical protein
VAFTEDSCLLAPGWAESWLAAFADPAVAVATGPVEHVAGRSALDWAVFFCEYAPFLLPLRGRAARQLAGNNFAGRRVWIEKAIVSGEIHESMLFDSIRRHGGQAVTVELAKVWHVRQFGLREAIDDRLRFGREFGRLRAAAGWLGRGPAGVAGPLIWLAQVVRLVRTLLRKRRHGGWFLDAWLVTLALLVAWSVGEWLGWLEGPPRLRSAACRRHETAARPSVRLLGRWRRRPARYSTAPRRA